MSYLTAPPAELEQVEYVRLYLHLEFSERFELPEFGLLRLRRELHQALRALADWGDSDDLRLLQQLLQPSLPNDPVIRRRAQKPAPAFVLSPDRNSHGHYSPGQMLVIPALFIGQGVRAVSAFVRLIAQLGQLGLEHGAGRFRLEAVETEDASGVRIMLWTAGQQTVSITPPINDLHWWLERQLINSEQLLLEFTSPLRLLKKQKPLFKLNFIDLFPFVLRRVNAMLDSHAGVEVIKDPLLLVTMAESLEEASNTLVWRDYRCLSGADRSQNLGGLLGGIGLAGSHLGNLLWILQLGSLLNIGKEATYGAGQFRLRTLC